MKTFARRATVLFALAATIPVVLTAIVWLAVVGSGGGGASSADLVRRRIDELDSRRSIAIARLCRDDLAVDRLLSERAEGLAPALDYGRLFRGVMEAAGLDALWIVDVATDDVVATGHRPLPAGLNGSELVRQAREAGDRPFVLAFGSQAHQQVIVRSCSISRGGARLLVLGGHRVSTLRELDPEAIAFTGTPRKNDETLLELVDAAGVAQGALVWREGAPKSAPPLLLWIACVAALSVGLALLFGGHLNRWIQTSVDDLTEAATRVGRGDFDATLRDEGGGAFPATATAFNRMTRDLREARARLRQTERVAAWQEIARSLAHELKNPLSPIQLSIESLRKAHSRSLEEFDALFDESTRTILQEVNRLRNIVDEFSRFARLPPPTLRETDLRETVSQAASLHADGEVTLEVRLPSYALDALVDADQITQVLHNLLQNARDAASAHHPTGGGAVTISAESSGGTIFLRVEDNGPGIPPAQVASVFDPYYTTKEGGTGLGLAITQRIVTEHGGRIDVESKPGRTVFTVVLSSSVAKGAEGGLRGGGGWAV